MQLSPRYATFWNEYQKTGNILQSGLKAGFSEQYCRHQGKRILNTAVRIQTNILNNKATKQEITANDGKKLMHELVGMSSNEVMKRLKTIANQDKDLSSALKVLAPLSKQLGVDITQQEGSNVVIPVLNIGIVKTDTPENGSIEP